MTNHNSYFSRRQFIRISALSSIALFLRATPIEHVAAAQPRGKRPVSYVRTAFGKSFVVAYGQPYLIYGIQIRIDHLVWQPTADSDWSKPDEYFRMAVDVGFRTIVVPVHWSYVEPTEGVYTFSSDVDKIIDSAEKYGLKLQILWYGADVCGFNLAPDYVKNDRVRFPRNENLDYFLDLSSQNLIAANRAALTALMEHIAEYDVHNRIIMVQVENEPDGAGDLVSNVHWGNPVDEAAKMYAGNQLQALASLLNILGNALHESSRNVVTRCNLGTPFRVLELYNTLKQLGSGIDIVGVDTYSHDPQETKTILNTIPIGTVQNVAHQPEGDAKASNLINLVLSNFEEGGGFLIYDLIGLLRGTETVDPTTWTGRDGSATVTYWINGSKYESPELKTADLKAFNEVVYKADKRIAVAPKGKCAAFNVAGNSGSWKESRMTGNTSVRFATPTGSTAFAIQEDNCDLIIMSFGKDSVFTVNPAYALTSLASVGHFNENDIWFEEYKMPMTENTLTLAYGEVAYLTISQKPSGRN